MPNSPDFPKRIPEKLKAIREHLALTPDELASFVGAKTGAEILGMRMAKMICLSRCCGLRETIRQPTNELDG